MVYRDAKESGIDSELLRYELPSEPDRVAFEVVAEREVPQHLKKGVMPGGMPDLFEIVVLTASAHAFLRRRGSATAGGVLDAQKDFFELHHAGVGE